MIESGAIEDGLGKSVGGDEAREDAVDDLYEALYGKAAKEPTGEMPSEGEGAEEATGDKGSEKSGERREEIFDREVLKADADLGVRAEDRRHAARVDPPERGQAVREPSAAACTSCC